MYIYRGMVVCVVSPPPSDPSGWFVWWLGSSHKWAPRGLHKTASIDRDWIPSKDLMGISKTRPTVTAARRPTWTSYTGHACHFTLAVGLNWRILAVDFLPVGSWQLSARRSTHVQSVTRARSMIGIAVVIPSRYWRYCVLWCGLTEWSELLTARWGQLSPQI